MKHLDSKYLENLIAINRSRMAIIYECNYNNRNYIYKSFFLKSCGDCNEFDKRFSSLESLKLKYSVIPEYIMETKSFVDGYLTEKALFKKIDEIDDPLERYNALLQLKEAIMELHNNGVIHGDIHSGNIVLMDNRYCLIDFDNCENENFGVYLKPKNALYCAYEFMMKNGITRDLDIFLYNILTFRLLSYTDLMYSDSKNCVNLASIKSYIRIGEYGLFERKDSKQICDSILSCSVSDYLIDTIDESDVKRYFKKV